MRGNLVWVWSCVALLGRHGCTRLGRGGQRERNEVNASDGGRQVAGHAVRSRELVQVDVFACYELLRAFAKLLLLLEVHESRSYCRLLRCEVTTETDEFYNLTRRPLVRSF